MITIQNFQKKQLKYFYFKSIKIEIGLLPLDCVSFFFFTFNLFYLCIYFVLVYAMKHEFGLCTLEILHFIRSNQRIQVYLRTLIPTIKIG